MVLRSPCGNCKKVNCLKGQPLTDAWEGLKVQMSKPGLCVNRQDDHIVRSTSGREGGRVLLYYKPGMSSIDEITISLYDGTENTTKLPFSGRLLVENNRYEPNQYLYPSLDGFVYNC